MKKEKLYKERGKFKPSGKLSDEHYRQSLKRFVKYCCEVILVNKNGNFVLPVRKFEKSGGGVWFFGGQVLAFTSIENSAKETLRRESGLKLPFSRFKHLGRFRHWYNGQEFDNTPHDALSEVFIVRVTDAEIKRIKLDTTEFQDGSLQEFDTKKIKAISKKTNRQVILDLWNLYNQTKPL